MRQLADVPYALPALLSSLSMGVVTTVHHLHAMTWVDPLGTALHVVWSEVVILPVTLASMLIFVRTGNRLARRVLLVIAALGFAGLAAYEGGWNHTLEVLAHLRIDSPSTDIQTLFPIGHPHQWFYQLSGVLTFIVALTATYHSVRFAIASRDDRSAQGVLRTALRTIEHRRSPGSP